MTFTLKALINGKYAESANTTEYTAPASTKTIIDKFVACNIDVAPRTISINLVKSGDTVGSPNMLIQAKSLNAGATYDFTELKGLVLETGDYINVVASVANTIAIRAAGREIS